MKYFTSKWWSFDSCEEGDDTFERYRSYIASIRDKLSPDPLTLVEQVSLHDARVRSFSLSGPRKRAKLILAGYDYSPLDRGDPPAKVRFTLQYQGISALLVRGRCNELCAWFKNSDLGYSELECLPGDVFEHRMLFSSGNEVIVRFRQFELESVPAGTARRPRSARR